MKVLSAAAEIYPLVKTGGLADVVGALPAALAGQGVAMRCLVPGYRQVMSALGGIAVLHRYADLFGGQAECFGLHLDRRRLELGIDVERRVLQLHHAERGAVLHVGTQHVAGGDLRDAELFLYKGGLCTLACTWPAQQN